MDISSVALDEISIAGWIRMDNNAGDTRIIAKAIGTAEENHVWMVSEHNAEEIECFALEPVYADPYIHY